MQYATPISFALYVIFALFILMKKEHCKQKKNGNDHVCIWENLANIKC